MTIIQFLCYDFRYKDGRPLIKDHSASLLRNSDSRDVGFEDSLGETISHLSLDCVSENDAGYYECVATNSNGQKTTVGTEVNVVSKFIIPLLLLMLLMLLLLLMMMLLLLMMLLLFSESSKPVFLIIW